MESTIQEPSVVDELPETKCISCGSEEVILGYANLLCAGCREQYIKFPIPIWIKAFGTGVGLLVIFSLFSFFGNLQSGIHMERGLRAENKHQYLTAQREFEEVVKKVPGNTEAKAHLLIAAFYNQDMKKMVEMSRSLEGKKFDDNELYEKTDGVMNLGAMLFPSDSLSALYEKFKDDTSSNRTAAISSYYKNNPTDFSAALEVASDAINKKDYARADTVLQKLLISKPESVTAISLLATVKRYEKDAPNALKYIDQLLTHNKEDVYALSSKARIMIMMRKDNEALKLAHEAYKLDQTFPFNLATLAIVYHYTDKIKERDEIINKAKASGDSSVMEYMEYALDIINNKQKLRN